MRKMNHLMTKNGTKMKQLRRTNGRMMELKQARRNSSRMKASICCDCDRHREHLGVSQTNKAKKKKSTRRPIDPEDISGSISSAPERISHDTHLFAIPFGRISDGTPSPTGTSPQLSAMRIGYSSSKQSDAMAGTPPLTQHFVHPSVSPSSTAVPSATPDVEMPTLALGHKDRLGRVMIESDESYFYLQEKELGRPPIEPKVSKKTDVKKKENESDTDVWVEERAKLTFLGLEGIESSRQAEALHGVQVAAMSAQIAQLTSTLAESERRIVAEQQSMSATVQEIKEQVLNLAHRPTTSSLAKDTDDDSDEDDDFIDRTP
ncbi:hypothetical protein MTR67_018363 [Solanum verrucosum]|uniref:Uncharacterized protein n=1 Tax=Solanum verrucosum TaxID=315347 RepID=A0AAF0QMC4_SOLVR|nr:hypothetical protein MTR67_018363 [Solanum verrucosum]